MPNRCSSSTGKSRLKQFLRDQQLFVFIGTLSFAVIYIFRVRVRFGAIIILALCVGNVLQTALRFAHPWYANLRPPWNWVAFLPILTVISVIGTLIADAALYWASIFRGSYVDIVRATTPFTVLVCIVTGIVYYMVELIELRLQEKNTQLQAALDTEKSALQSQNQELTRARQIQQELLPDSIPQVRGIDIAGAWQPAATIGGDYYDVISLDEHNLGICIGDVVGKGITAALLMANLQAAFRAFATPGASPATVCAKLNTFLCGNMADGKFISFFYGVLDTRTLALSYENAGHCPALLVRKSGEAVKLVGDGAVLGVLDDWIYRDSQMRLQSGDRLVLFTDGVAEAEDQTGEEFGEERILRATVASDGNHADDIRKHLMTAVAKHCNGAFRDDATCLVLVVH